MWRRRRISGEDLVRGLGSRWPWVRLDAARRCGQVRGAHAAVALVNALDDGNEFVRREVARVIERNGTQKMVRHLRRAIADPDPGVGLAAIAALGRVGGDDAAGALSDVLFAGSSEAREAASRMLAGLGAAGAERLLAAARSGNEAARSWAVAAIGQIRDPEAVPVLLSPSPGMDRLTREHAAQALGSIGASEAVPTLVAWLGDASPDLRKAAAQALGRIAAPVAEALVRLRALQQQDEVPPVRHAAGDAADHIEAAIRRGPAELLSASSPAGTGTELQSADAPAGRGTEVESV